MTAAQIAEMLLKAAVTIGPDIYKIITAPDGPARVAAVIQAGFDADEAALEAARHEVDTKVEKLPHRDGSNPSSGR